jgi:hypothetical protein
MLLRLRALSYQNQYGSGSRSVPAKVLRRDSPTVSAMEQKVRLIDNV